MKRRDILVSGFATMLVASCGGTWSVDYEEGVDPTVARGWRVASIDVVIPEELTVSEANTFAPNADIVWHGEEFGDRRWQVRAILTEGLFKGSSGLKGKRPVILSARLVQFHAVTPIAVDRAPSAVHNIKFDIQVFDARTKQPLTEPQRIAADLEANVGTAAVVAAINGDTQRVRIVRHLAAVTAGWLGKGPDQRHTFQTVGR